MATRKSAQNDDIETTEKPLSRRALVLIRRDQTTQTPRVVWLHEVPVLQEIFGADEVSEVDAPTLDEGYKAKASADLLPYNKRQDQILPPSLTNGLGDVFIGNAEAEYQRMAAAYGLHPDVKQPIVEHVYGRYSTGRFRSIVGRPTLTDLPDRQLRDLILSYGHPMPIATHESTNEENAEAAKAWADFRALKHDALVTLAEQAGVEIG